MRKYTVLGMTDERTSCDCCGKINLKKTVAMNDNETGTVVYFGVVCATDAKKYKNQSEIDIAKAAIKEAKSNKSWGYDRVAYTQDKRVIELINQNARLRAYEVDKIAAIQKQLHRIIEEFKNCRNY